MLSLIVLVLLLHTQEVIGLVREGGLVAESQAGRSVGYRQALEFLASVWRYPGNGPPYQLQVRAQCALCVCVCLVSAIGAS